MAQLFHLSSSNVSDTFHKLVQTEGGRFADGSGSAISLLYVTASHAISASHEITYEMSSSFANTASYVAGGNVHGTVASATVADTADCADQVKTIRTDDNNTFYIPFVGDNNSSATCEPVYTSAKFFINPSSGLLTLLGKFKVKGSDVTIDGGHISMSGHLHMSGTLSSSQVLTTNLGSDAQYITSASIGHISTFGDTIRFVDPVTKKTSGSLKFDQNGITVQSATTGDKTGAKVKWLLADDYIQTNGHITASGNISGSATSNLTLGGNITASGNITAYGHISSSYSIIGSSIQSPEIIGDQAYATSLDVGGSIWASGSTGHITSSNTITAHGSIYSEKAIIAKSNISSSRGLFGKTLYTTGAITASGDISASSTSTISGNTLRISTIGDKANGNGSITVTNALTLKTEAVDTIMNIGNDDVYLQVKGSTDNNLLQVNPQSLDKVGIGTATPTVKLQVAGDVAVTNITASGDISASGDVYVGAPGYGSKLILQGTVADGNYLYGNGSSTVTTAINSIAKFNVHQYGIQVGGAGSSPIGHITASNNISASGDVVATHFRGNGRIYPDYNLSSEHFLSKTSTTNPILRAAGGFKVDGHLTASSNLGTGTNISASGDIFANAATFQGKLEVGKGGVNTDGIFIGDGGATIFNIDGLRLQNNSMDPTQPTTPNVTIGPGAHLTASGHISASGTIHARHLIVSGAISCSKSLRVGTHLDFNNGANFIKSDGTNMMLLNPAGSQIQVYQTFRMNNDDGIAFGVNSDYLIMHSDASGQNELRFREGGDVRLVMGVGGHLTASANISSSESIRGLTGSFDYIKASGDISASGTATVNKLSIDGLSPLYENQGALKFGQGDGLTIEVGTATVTNIVDARDGHQVTYSTASLTGEGDYRGEVVKFGNTATTRGILYAHTGSGWTMADSGSGVATSSIALALGSNSTTDGMLLRGMVNVEGVADSSQGGTPLYMAGGNSAGRTTHVPPGQSGTYARIVGYNYGNDSLYFCPDNTWVKLS